MTVLNVKGQMVELGPGVAGAEAEATVSTPDGEKVFVYAESFDGCCNFAVLSESFYGTMDSDASLDDVDCMERYEAIADTTGSAYRKVFVVLDQVIQLMEGA